LGRAVFRRRNSEKSFEKGLGDGQLVEEWRSCCVATAVLLKGTRISVSAVSIVRTLGIPCAGSGESDAGWAARESPVLRPVGVTFNKFN
jgi:hypothetical protein